MTPVELATWLVLRLGPTATALGWDRGSPAVAVAVEDAVDAYGVASLGLATDMPKLKALGRVAIWRMATEQAAANYGLSDGGSSLQRQQVWDHAMRMLAMAEADAAPYGGPGYTVGVTRIRRVQDPYVVVPDLQRRGIP